MSATIFSVSYLSRILEEVIHGSLFHNIYLRGEIHSINSKGKYTYLTLIDSEDNGVITSSITVLLSPYTKLESKDFGVGDTVLLKGSLSYYKQRATVSFWADNLIIDGEGKELVRLKKLKEALAKEGLFDEEHKRELPLYPKGVGIVTSASGAAINDVKATLKRRYPIHIKVYSATVQGSEASKSLYSALKKAMADEDIDIILLTRGGGSKSDLAPFNDEAVVRLLYNSPYPVISAIGHQIDTSLTDLVADKTAITPTDAANMIGYSLNELAKNRYNYLEELKESFKTIYNNKKYEYMNTVLLLNSLSPQKRIENYQTKLKIYKEALSRPYINLLKTKMVEFKELNNEFNRNFVNILTIKENILKEYKMELSGASPQKILSMGYAYISKGDKSIISKKDVSSKDEVSIHLSDGEVKAVIK